MNKQELKNLLYSDLVNTMGCTDVGAVGYAAATAAKHLRGELMFVDLKLSDLLYKNSLRVGIPGTFRSGVDKAVLIGYLLKNPSKKLSVFEDADESVLTSMSKLSKKVIINISYEKKKDPLYIDLILKSNCSKVRVLMLHSYDNIQEIYLDDELIYENTHSKVFTLENDHKIDTTLDELLSYTLNNKNLKDFDKLIDFGTINLKTALKGLESNKLPSLTEDNFESAGSYVRKYILSACFLRMEGAAIPVTGVAGSGNLGITTLTSAYILSKMLNCNTNTTKQVLAIAILVSTYIKRQMTLLTTICGSALAGGAGVAAATAFLLGGNISEIKNAINILIAINAGTLCDGAKKSCAYKVAFSGENGVTAGIMAIKGEGFNDENGINKPDVEKSISNIAKINNEALEDARSKILTII